MPFVDAQHLRGVAAARGEAAFLRRAELLQMNVGYAMRVEAGGELALGEARAARSGDGAHVDQRRNPRLGQRVEEILRGRLLVADGEERRHGFTRSIRAIAAAGARIL